MIHTEEELKMLIILEGLVLAFWLVLICVVCMAKGPAAMAAFYEKDVQKRVVGLGLGTEEQVKKESLIAVLSMLIPVLFFVPAVVYLYNGANGFLDGFLQLTGIYLIAGLFDRIFIDEWWVCRTKAWIIPGTEDLMPYIPAAVKAKKWVGTVIGFTVLAAIIAGILQLFR